MIDPEECYQCEDCKEYTDSFRTTPSGEVICDDCAINNYEICDDCDNVFKNGSLINVDENEEEEGHYVCENCLDNYTITCKKCNKEYPIYHITNLFKIKNPFECYNCI